MRTTNEERAREHLRRSAATFLAATVTFSLGVLSMYQTLRLVSYVGPGGSGGIPTAYFALWAFCLVGFVAALWATSSIARNAPRAAG